MSTRPPALPRWVKPVVWLIGLGPVFYLVAGLFAGWLGANPVEVITHQTGEFALRLLIFTLFVTPLRQLTGYNAIIQVRRLLGLFAIFYAALHFATYAVLDASLDFTFVVEDIADRPYITVGFATLVLLVPLAVTSTRAMQRRLGGRRWRNLHRLAYIATAGAAVHFVWQAKIVTAEELSYAGAVVLLLLMRIPAIARTLPRLRPGARRQPAEPASSELAP